MSVQYIQGLKLATDVADIGVVRYLDAGAGPVIKDDVDAAVTAGTLVGFAGALTAQEKENVLFSIELADRTASAQYDRFDAVENWFRSFTDVLRQVGWAVTEAKKITRDDLGGEIKADKAALGIIMAAATGPALAILKAAVSALESMADKDDTITLYQHYSAKGNNAHIQLGAVDKAANGAISMGMGALNFETGDNRSKVLFATWGNRYQDYYFTYNEATFNQAQYDRLRQAIKDQFGKEALAFIRSIPLAPAVN
jgi:hypothetical protein